MPRMGAAIYGAHMDNVLRLARREGGVSRPQIISELNVSRAVANKLIDEAGLTQTHKTGRTEFFGAPDNDDAEVKQSKPDLPPEVEAAAEPVDGRTGDASSDSQLADLDDQIFKTRDLIRLEAEKAGNALGKWAHHQAMVDGLRSQMADLVARRMKLSK